MEDIMDEEDNGPPISLVEEVTDKMKCNKDHLQSPVRSSVSLEMIAVGISCSALEYFITRRQECYYFLTGDLIFWSD